VETRQEHDSLGPVAVPAARYWGAQTQRALDNFPRCGPPLPRSLIHAFAVIKRAAATVNADLGVLEPEIAQAIVQAADEIRDGRLAPAEFPLGEWQSGSGTQTNMNVNEVLANRASELLGGSRGRGRRVHPNDHVNRSQSTNDTFPTAMHVAAVLETRGRLLPRLATLQGTFEGLATRFGDVVKTGRTHLMDATPVTLRQVFGAWASQLDAAGQAILGALQPLRALPLGGTAVGTGLNTPPGYAEQAVAEVSRLTGEDFEPAANRLALTASHDPVVGLSGALRGLATGLIKIANDVRWLASGPRCGLGELELPANEPGSSIMPGKVNPSQCEMLTMACAHVVGRDATVGFAGSQGNFELNAYKPVLAAAVLDSVTVLAEAIASFDRRCATGIEPRRERIAELLDRSLMLVTALAPELGYDRAAEIAKKAHAEGTSLREAAVALDYATAAEFDRIVRPEVMARPHAPGEGG